MKLSECFEQLTPDRYRVKSNIPSSFRSFFNLDSEVVNFELRFFNAEHFGRFDILAKHLNTVYELTCDFSFVRLMPGSTEFEAPKNKQVTIFRSFGSLYLRIEDSNKVVLAPSLCDLLLTVS